MYKLRTLFSTYKQCSSWLIPIPIIVGNYWFNHNKNRANIWDFIPIKRHLVLRGAHLVDNPKQEVYNKALSAVVYISSVAGTGTGVIVSDTGYIVTNSHMVEDLSHVNISLSKPYAQKDLLRHNTSASAVPAIKGQVVYVEPHIDLALVRIHVKPGVISALSLSSRSSEPIVGEPVMAIGNPTQNNWSTAHGLITGVNRTGGRSLGVDQYFDYTTHADHQYIALQAPIIRGFSGGPLLDTGGHLIGIQFAGLLETNWSVCAKDVQKFVERGLIFETENREMRYSCEKKKSLGVMFEKQADNAFKVIGFGVNNPLNNNSTNGLQINDIVTKVNGNSFVYIDQLADSLERLTDGQPLQLTVKRNGSDVPLSVVPITGRNHRCSSC